MKKYIALLIICLLIFLGLKVIVFNKDNKVIDRASKEEALAYAMEFINERINSKSEDTNKWVQGTAVGMVKEVYDIKENVVSYILNLKNNNKECGYIVIDLLDENKIEISEFGYEGRYYVTKEELCGEDEKNKIYVAGGGYYIQQSEDTYVEAHSLMEGKKVVKLTKNQLKKK